MTFVSALFGRRGTDFETLCEKAKNDLATKTSAHQAMWGLGTSERWDLDQETGRLAFTFSDKIISCEAQIIGTWNSRAKTWLWGWGNTSVLKPLAGVSERLRDYGVRRAIEKLTTAKWTAGEEDAWLMVALAALLFEQQGAYRGPAGETFVFMTFGELTTRKR